jgi:hypothetical protein
MKAYGGVVNFTSRPLYPLGNSPRCPVDRQLGGPQSWSGRRAEEKILDPNGTRVPTPRWPSPQSVAIPTDLTRLLDKTWWSLNKRGSVEGPSKGYESIDTFSGRDALSTELSSPLLWHSRDLRIQQIHYKQNRGNTQRAFMIARRIISIQ